MNNCRTRIAELQLLEPELVGKQVELQQLKRKAEDLMTEVARSEKSSAVNTEQLNALTSEHSTLEKDCDHLREILCQLTDQVNQAETTLNDSYKANEAIRFLNFF